MNHDYFFRTKREAIQFFRSHHNVEYKHEPSGTVMNGYLWSLDFVYDGCTYQVFDKYQV